MRASDCPLNGRDRGRSRPAGCSTPTEEVNSAKENVLLVSGATDLNPNFAE